jgi:hypothetical protein
VLLRSADLREAVREGREGNLVLFVVDSSGSMAARSRTAAVKGAVLSLLLDAYQRRDKVGLVTFRGNDAELALPPTSSVEPQRLAWPRSPQAGARRCRPGCCARRGAARRSGRDAGRRALVVVVTDGRHTSGPPPELAAAHLLRTGAACVVVDCESGPVRSAWRRSSERSWAVSRCGWRSCPPRRSPRSRRASRRRSGGPPDAVDLEDRLMPQGQPTSVPDDGLTTRQRRNRPLLVVHTGR